jgi:large subunit ribosomal protein L22
MGKQSAPRRVGDKEALAVGTTIRGSAQKLGLVAALIRGRKVEDALNILTFSTKGMAPEVRKVLASAIANAENNHNLDVDSLFVQEASVGKALTMKRFMARGRGKSSRIVKPFSRLRIVVREREEEA